MCLGRASERIKDDDSRKRPKKKLTREREREDKKEKKNALSLCSVHHFQDAHFDRRTHTLNNKLTRVF